MRSIASRGYSSIELLAVLAATMLVFALATSAYRTHAVREQIASSIARTASIETRIAAASRRLGEPPADAAEAGLATEDVQGSGQYVDSLSIIDGRIELKFGGHADPAIHGRTLSLTPFETADREIVWLCGNRVPSPGLNPLGFANGSHRAVQLLSRIDARYLPASCR
jgi:hypothetical protein